MASRSGGVRWCWCLPLLKHCPNALGSLGRRRETGEAACSCVLAAGECPALLASHSTAADAAPAHAFRAGSAPETLTPQIQHDGEACKACGQEGSPPARGAARGGPLRACSRRLRVLERCSCSIAAQQALPCTAPPLCRRPPPAACGHCLLQGWLHARTAVPTGVPLQPGCPHSLPTPLLLTHHARRARRRRAPPRPSLLAAALARRSTCSASSRVK